MLYLPKMSKVRRSNYAPQFVTSKGILPYFLPVTDEWNLRSKEKNLATTATSNQTHI